MVLQPVQHNKTIKQFVIFLEKLYRKHIKKIKFLFCNMYKFHNSYFVIFGKFVNFVISIVLDFHVFHYLGSHARGYWSSSLSSKRPHDFVPHHPRHAIVGMRLVVNYDPGDLQLNVIFRLRGSVFPKAFKLAIKQ